MDIEHKPLLRRANFHLSKDVSQCDNDRFLAGASHGPVASDVLFDLLVYSVIRSFYLSFSQTLDLLSCLLPHKPFGSGDVDYHQS